MTIKVHLKRICISFQGFSLTWKLQPRTDRQTDRQTETQNDKVTYRCRLTLLKTNRSCAPCSELSCILNGFEVRQLSWRTHLHRQNGALQIEFLIRYSPKLLLINTNQPSIFLLISKMHLLIIQCVLMKHYDDIWQSSIGTLCSQRI